MKRFLKSLTIVFLLISHGIFCQNHSTIKICDIKEGQKIQEEFGQIRSKDMFSTYGQSRILFTLEEGQNYRVWINDEEIGSFPKSLDFEPKMDLKGNIFLPIKQDGKKYLRVNNKHFGPFDKIESAFIQNGRLVVGAYVYIKGKANQCKWFVDGKLLFSGSKYSKVYIDSNKDVWSVRPSKNYNYKDIYLNDKMIEKEVQIPWSSFKENGFFFYYRKERGAPKYFYINGKKGGPIDGYSGGSINQFGDFIGYQEIDSTCYIRTNDYLHGPFVKGAKGTGVIKGKNGIITFSPSLVDEGKTDVFWNRKHIAIYDDFDALVNYYSENGVGEGCFYYLENGKHKLGSEDGEIGTAKAKIIEAFVMGENNIYRDENYNVYINGKMYKQYDGVQSVRINEKGEFLFRFRNDKGYGVNLNGKEIPFSKNEHPRLILNKSYSHFLAYRPLDDSIFLIDDAEFDNVKGKTNFYYNENADTFHWLQVVGKEVFWHSYSFD